ncbi:MAG: 50S ribosomal protein L1 [Candidatus Saccharimonadales bacterium]
MAKKELLEEAKAAGIEVDSKMKVSEIKALIDAKRPKEEDKVETESPKTEDVETAKAGKRSAKALAEAKDKEEKEARKASASQEETKPKPQAPPTRSRLERRGKGYKNTAKLIEKGTLYPLDKAIDLAKKTSHVKFDATVELHINLGVDPKHADQNIRDMVVLPAGTGKKVRVAVLTDDAAAAKAAGADIAGLEDILAQLDKGTINFDTLITSPNQMAKLGKYARVLGPRGLMPNPKSGTVTTDISKAVNEAKGGKVEYRVDSTGIVHIGVGKVSFDDAKLNQNLNAVFASVKSNKPQSVKGTYIKGAFLATSMGPSIPVDITSIG